MNLDDNDPLDLANTSVTFLNATQRNTLWESVI